MPEEYSVAGKSGSVTRLIAYLSVCMLAAAFGSMLDQVWGRWWAIFGTFGLTSAVALDALCRCRARAEDFKKRGKLSSQAKKHVDKMMREIEASDAMLAALHRIQPKITDSEPQRGDSRADPRRPVNAPVTITLVCPSSGKLGESFRGSIRNISRHGVGLAHDRCLEREFVLLEIEGKNGEPILFIAHVLWCELQASGQYFSGGKLVELLGPICFDPRSKLAAGTSETENSQCQ